jgi:hypothetical protein
MANHLKAWSIPALALAVTSGAALAHALNAPVGGVPSTNDTTASAAAPIRVQFNAPADCAGEQEFVSRLRSRTRDGGPHASVQVDIVRVGAELAGEARITRAGGGAPTSVVAVGTCESIVGKLAQLTAQALLAAPLESQAVRDGILPANPYRQWRGPVAESLPRNPYPQLLNDIGPGEQGAQQPQPQPQPQRGEERIAARNPYRW